MPTAETISYNTDRYKMYKNLSTLRSTEWEIRQQTEEVEIQQQKAEVDLLDVHEERDVETMEEGEVQKFQQQESVLEEIQESEEQQGQHFEEVHKRQLEVEKPEPTDDERFQSRYNLIQELCKDKKNANHTWYHRLGPKTEKALFDCRLRYCRVPKVGSTYLHELKWHFAKLYNIFQSQHACHDVVPKTFVIVREPYSRLVSAYFDKIVTIPLWWRNFGGFIVKEFRGGDDISPGHVGCGHDVSFDEFVRFFIFSETEETMQDPHLIPMYKLCDICHQHYDFIGKLETFTEDVKYIYKQINESADIGISSDVAKIESKCLNFATLFKEQNYSECMDICEGHKRVWYGFQSMGLVPRNYNFPFSENRCRNLSGWEFSEVTKKVYFGTKGKFDKHQQKDDFLRESYREVSLEVRLKLYSILKKDLDFFGYDPFPENVFPEYYKS